MYIYIYTYIDIHIYIYICILRVSESSATAVCSDGTPPNLPNTQSRNREMFDGFCSSRLLSLRGEFPLEKI